MLLAACAADPAGPNLTNATGVPAVPGAFGDEPPPPPPRPRPDHIVVVVEENHASGEILGNLVDAAYFNDLASRGVLFTSSFAIEHPSQPNYLDLFAGGNQGVTDDSCPHTFSAPNLARELADAGFTFAGYSEGLPAEGATDCNAGDYWRKHNPWVNFDNVPASANRTFAAFPADFAQLPTVSFVIPDQQHDMHDGTIRQADDWLRANLGAYADWAPAHNSLLIVTFDEDDNSTGNHIFTIAVGAGLAPRHEPERISHWNVLRTLVDLYGLPPIGTSAKAAAIDVWGDRPTDRHRTVVFVHATTSPGQNLLVRGGIDYGYAGAQLSRDCNVDPGGCQVPIAHRNLRDASTAPLKANDDFLDWLGAEPNQDSAAVGTPADWTIDHWPPAWGPAKTVAVDGYGEELLNTWGADEWMLDVDMDCARTVAGWFEVKSFVQNGSGWEPDVAQAGTPYATANHMGQCGKLNRFDFGASTVEIHDL